MSHLFTVHARIRSMLAALLLSVPALPQLALVPSVANSRMSLTQPMTMPKPAHASATLLNLKATPTLTVPTNGTLALDDLGPHVMLVGVLGSLPGETVPAMLSGAAGHTLAIRAPVWNHLSP